MYLVSPHCMYLQRMPWWIIRVLSEKRKVRNNFGHDHSEKHIFRTSFTKCNSSADSDLNEDEVSELETAEFMENEASKLIQKGDIAVIKTGDDHPYYLLKLTKSHTKQRSWLGMIMAMIFHHFIVSLKDIILNCIKHLKKVMCTT